jgi:phage repressor protein C with HTH and peptisase S24 domain
MDLRLSQYRKRAKMTLEDVAERIGLSHGQVSRLENRRSDVTLGQLQEFARLYRCEIADLIASDATKAPLVGAVGAGETISPFSGDATFEDIDAPRGLKFPVAVVVRGESMEPAYRDGDLLIYERADGVARAALGRDCVCETADHNMYVKVLQKGSRADRYDLVSYNPRHPPIRDARVLWASPIDWIRRA